MNLLADGLFQLRGFPRHAVNVYLMGGVLVDAGYRFDRGRILRQLGGHDVTAHALTHAHPDHQGASDAVCRAWGVPFWCGADDVAAAEDPRVLFARMPRHPVNRWVSPWFAGPGHRVDRTLAEGDEVGGFTVIATPGHTAGHVSYWREADRTLVLGDVLANLNVLTGGPGLREPPWFFSADPGLNRESARRVAALRPALVCFGHGPPLRDPDAFERFVASLPA